jgi:hypothetical protein
VDYFENGMRFNHGFNTGQKVGTPIARLNNPGAKEEVSKPKEAFRSNTIPPKKKNPPIIFLVNEISVVCKLIGISFFRLVAKLETPNQITDWIKPPSPTSSGEINPPPDAITSPTTKPTAAQNLGLDVFINEK